MKKSLHRIAISLVLCAFLGSVALAGGKTRSVTFYEDTRVGDTIVKKGTYSVSFDEKSNELIISKNRKVVASVSARLEDRAGTPNTTATSYATLKGTESTVRLSRISIADKQAIIGDNVTTSVTGQQ